MIKRRKMTDRVDLLFVHEGKEIDQGENRIALFPIGVLGMADLLERRGIRTRILHHLIEKKLSPEFRLVREIADTGVKMVCLDLQWHQQITSVLRLAKAVKKRHPGIPVVLGGLTATFFCKEIMEECPEIDFLIRGDAETPILKLARAVLKKKPALLKDIPNLVYRKGPALRFNPLSYSFNEKMASKISFSNFELLKHWEYYNRPRVFEGIITTGPAEKLADNPVIFHYPCGRGCPNNCSICSGSRLSQKKISGRDRIVPIPVKNVVQDIKNAVKYGIDTWYNTFDPTINKDYFIGLFKELAKQDIKIGLQFECLQIPPPVFIRSAERVFKKVRLDFVIQTGSDTLRRKIKGNYFSNQALIDFLAGIKDTNIRVDLCLVAGLPFETKDDVIKTLSFVNFIRTHFPNVQCIATFLEVEPGSPVHTDPARFGVKLLRRTFGDYLKDHQKISGLGYETAHFDSEDISCIRRYYNAEAHCKKRISNFLVGLLNHLFAVQDTDIRFWHGFCEECEHYRACFKTVDIDEKKE